jgi:hypothetical protein
VVPFKFYREKVLAKSEQRARKILALKNDDGTVPKYLESGLRKACLTLSINLSAFALYPLHLLVEITQTF